MLNYWRTTGGGAATLFTGNSRPTTNNTLIPAFSDYAFDGPFFDLEFTLSNDQASETGEEIELNLDIQDQDFEISPLQENTKFRLLLPKLKKPNSSNGVVEEGEKSEKTEASDNKLVRVKFKVDEVKGPLISLFARDISISEDSSTNSANLGKETLQKYLNILKPLYVRVEKMRLHGGGGTVSPPPPPMVKAGVRSNNLQAGLKVVRKHLGKSRSTSAAAAVSPPGSNRRDDSLLELQDGIQGAILHCKRSFNSDREGESAIFSRSVVSDPYCDCDNSVIASASHSGQAIETGV